MWTNFASSERFPLKNAPNVATLKGKSHQIEANSHDVVVRSEKKRGTAVITRSFEVQGGVVVVVVVVLRCLKCSYFLGMVDPHPLRLYPCFFRGAG